MQVIVLVSTLRCIAATGLFNSLTSISDRRHLYSKRLPVVCLTGERCPLTWSRQQLCAAELLPDLAALFDRSSAFAYLFVCLFVSRQELPRRRTSC